jgi:short-subunit dehydrogenase
LQHVKAIVNKRRNNVYLANNKKQDTMKIQDNVFVVTGGGNGMGRELVCNLLAKGAKVVAADLDEAALFKTATGAGGKEDSLITVVANITNKEQVENLVEKTLSTFGVVDGLINNAGIIQPFRKINDTGFDVIERIFNVNLFGTIRMIKAFLPHLLHRPEAHIVNVSSMGGFVPVAGQAMYGASKAAVKLLSDALASELTETNVKVTTVIPGAMYTDIKAHSGLGAEAGAGTEGHDKNRALSPSVAADIITKAIEKNRPCVFAGKDAKTMNLLYRISPRMATNMIYRQIKHKI